MVNHPIPIIHKFSDGQLANVINALCVWEDQGTVAQQLDTSKWKVICTIHVL